MDHSDYQEIIEKYKNFQPNHKKAISIVTTLFLLAIFLIQVSANSNGLIWFLAQIILGFVILQWFFLLHDLGHDHYFKSSAINGFVGYIASFFCILPFFPWKYIHRTHHLWTGWKDKDPTMTIIIPRYFPAWKKNLINFCWKFWIPIFSLSFSFANFWNIKKLYRLFPQYLGKNLLSILLPVLLHLFIIKKFGFGNYLHTYSLSYFIFLFLCDPLLLSQHSSIPQKISKGNKVSPIPFREQDQFTRSLIFPKWASKYLFLGFNNHIVHHLIPTLPGYLLTEIEIQNKNDENWYSWLSKAKKNNGYNLLISENSNLLDQ